MISWGGAGGGGGVALELPCDKGEDVSRLP